MRNFCDKVPEVDGYYRVFSDIYSEGQIAYISRVSVTKNNVIDFAIQFDFETVFLRVRKKEQFIRKDSKWVKYNYLWLDKGYSLNIKVNKVSDNLIEIIERINKSIEKTLININQILMIKSPEKDSDDNYAVSIFFSGNVKNIIVKSEENAFQTYDYLKTFL